MLDRTNLASWDVWKSSLHNLVVSQGRRCHSCTNLGVVMVESAIMLCSFLIWALDLLQKKSQLFIGARHLVYGLFRRGP
jgi:hypothetical protein